QCCRGPPRPGRQRSRTGDALAAYAALGGRAQPCPLRRARFGAAGGQCRGRSRRSAHLQGHDLWGLGRARPPGRGTGVHARRPAALDELGIEAALEGLVERTSGGGMQIDLNVELTSEHGRSPMRLGPELETALYRIVQEALTNAAKHGQAGRAVVEVRADATTVQLS